MTALISSSFILQNSLRISSVCSPNNGERFTTAVVKRSPLLGEHTEEILKEFCNMNDEDISAVKEAGAV